MKSWIIKRANRNIYHDSDEGTGSGNYVLSNKEIIITNNENIKQLKT